MVATIAVLRNGALVTIATLLPLMILPSVYIRRRQFFIPRPFRPQPFDDPDRSMLLPYNALRISDETRYREGGSLGSASGFEPCVECTFSYILSFDGSRE
jgi:hypothetical protein